jgi:NTE family protein
MFQAVEIGGEHYWDGGYSGNPTITPLVRECRSRDTMLVQINPVMRDAIPTTAREIVNRLSEVSFNAVLLKELRMIALLRQVAEADHEHADCETARWAGMRIHRIASAAVDALGASSKLNAEWAFLTMLRDEGRKAAQLFLDAHRGDVGVRSTFDIDVLTDEG